MKVMNNGEVKAALELDSDSEGSSDESDDYEIMKMYS